MALITIGLSFGNLCATGGFLVVHSDMCGPFTGIVFSMTNTIANMAGILVPVMVAQVAPNVRTTTLQFCQDSTMIIVFLFFSRELGLNGTMCSF